MMVESWPTRPRARYHLEVSAVAKTEIDEATGLEVVRDKKGALMSPLDTIRQQKGALRNLSFEELTKLAATLEEAGEGLDATQAGDGFRLLKRDDKKLLVGVPFVILDWDIFPSKERPGQYFTSAEIKTEHAISKLGGDTFRLNDGSTGIHAQLKDLRLRGFTGLLVCRNGLRVSEKYVVTEPAYDEAGEPIMDQETGKQVQKPKVDPVTGEQIISTTYYLDTSL